MTRFGYTRAQDVSWGRAAYQCLAEAPKYAALPVGQKWSAAKRRDTEVLCGVP